MTRKGTKWETETIEIPISEFDVQHQFHDLVYGDGEKNSFVWTFPTKETRRLINVKFVSEEQQIEEYDNRVASGELREDVYVHNSDILERVKQQYIEEKSNGKR